MNKTVVPSIQSLERHWYVVDAENKCLGRLASEVAQVLRGKNKPTFTPHLDAGDFVIVINAEKVRVGGMKVETFSALQGRIPERIVETAIKGMLPHNALGRQLFRKLKVYKGTEHPHAAQLPQILELNPAATLK